MSSEDFLIQNHSYAFIRFKTSKIFATMAKTGDNGWTATLSLCGIILLSYAAILSLHIRCSSSCLMEPVDKTPQIQEIVHTKR
jgi:hypothetical protein